MHVYRIHPEYTQTGEPYAHWVDDGAALTDTPHDHVGSVLDEWPTDLEFPLQRTGNDCDVYFNPCTLIFSRASRDELAPVCGAEAEWLPTRVIGYGEMYVLHPVSSVPLGANARFRQHRPDDNIVEIYSYDFDEPENLPTCFLVPQPVSSPAGKMGASCSGVFVTDVLHHAMARYRGIDFARVYSSPKIVE